MKKYIYNAQNTTLAKLRVDLLSEAQSAVRAVGRNVSWLRFARRIRGTYGYRVLRHKQKTRQLLTEIIDKVAPRHPTFSQGQVVDALDELVNNPHELKK